MSFFNKNKILLIILFSAIIIALAVYFGWRSRGTSTSSSIAPSIFQGPTRTPTSIINQNPTPTTFAPLPKETITPITLIGVPRLDENQIKKGLMSKTIIPEEKLEFEIGERLDRENKILLRGTVKNKEEEHGAGFFAYCDLQKCEVTFVGQEIPKCIEVNPYGYPLDWADYCLNEKGEVVKR